MSDSYLHVILINALCAVCFAAKVFPLASIFSLDGKLHICTLQESFLHQYGTLNLDVSFIPVEIMPPISFLPSWILPSEYEYPLGNFLLSGWKSQPC